MCNVEGTWATVATAMVPGVARRSVAHIGVIVDAAMVFVCREELRSRSIAPMTPSVVFHDVY